MKRCIDRHEAVCKHYPRLCKKCLSFREETNGDRIQSMSNEDLIEWAQKQIGCGSEFFPCGIVCDGKCDTFTEEDCKAKILKWLEKPVEDS